MGPSPANVWAKPVPPTVSGRGHRCDRVAPQTTTSTRRSAPSETAGADRPVPGGPQTHIEDIAQDQPHPPEHEGANETEVTSTEVAPTTETRLPQSFSHSHETRVDALLAPNEPAPVRRMNLNVVPDQGKTNAWSIQPEVVVAIQKLRWPQGVKFRWLDDLYPLDYDSNSTEEGRSVFRHHFLVDPIIGNPPYLPQRASPTSPVLTLADHVRQMIRCARNGQVPIILTLPF